MKKKINVLHIASFEGNIGDNANHIGAKYLRDLFLDFEFVITRKEIRQLYWKEWSFNSEIFVNEANSFDLLMIGGGNYFELWVKNSKSGTSIDIEINTLQKIKTPILFYSLGCDIGQGVPKENIIVFKTFLDYLTNSPKYFVSLRNDGSFDNLRVLYGDKYDNTIVEIPDGGFFMQISNLEHCEIEKDKVNIIINLAGDMLDIRFSAFSNNISYETFTKGFAQLLDALSLDYENNINFIFVPHIFRDLKIIYDIIDIMNDKYRRKCVKVAPYLTGDRGYRYIFSLYNQVQLVLGMRFHSNVCAIALKRNVIGLSNYLQIENLYKNLRSKEYVAVNQFGFQNVLKSKIIDHLKNEDIYIRSTESIINELTVQAREGYIKLNQWIKLNFGGTENE